MIASSERSGRPSNKELGLTGFGATPILEVLRQYDGPVRLLGSDCFRAFVDGSGHIVELAYESSTSSTPRRSQRQYRDAAMDRQGKLLVVEQDGRHCQLFSSLNDLFDGNGLPTEHDKPDGQGESSTYPLADFTLPGSVRKVHAGGAHFLIELEGQEEPVPTLFAIGDNRHFQQGHCHQNKPGASSAMTPRPIVSLQDNDVHIPSKVTLGDLHSCVLSQEGGLYVAGSDGQGQCSGFASSTGFNFVDLDDDDDLDVLDVACGSNHTIALTNKGVFACGGSE